MKLKVEVGGETCSVEGDDVLGWRELTPSDAREGVALARDHAAAYVIEHPSPELDAQGGANVPARQRMALLRRLAAGPATKRELLAEMRSAAGYVRGDDWRNRMDELRGHGKRGGGHVALPLRHDPAGDTYRLTESFAALPAADLTALAQAKGALGALGGLAHRGQIILDEMLPNVAASPLEQSPVTYPARAILQRFDRAMREQFAVEITYRPQDRPITTYQVVPRAYLPGDTAVRAFVVKLRPDGHRDSGRQIALDRLVGVEMLDLAPADDVFVDPAERLELWVTTPLRDVLRTRTLFGIDPDEAVEQDDDLGGTWVVTGTFNPELSWEVLRVLLSWTGSVRIAAPNWLAVTFAQRCLEGLLVQLSHPHASDRATYPVVGDHDASERLAGLEDMVGPFEDALERLRPPPPRKLVVLPGGKAAPVAPPDWLLDDS